MATETSAETKPLDSRAFGVALGLLWAGGVAALGVMARFGWGERWQQLLGDVYVGYDESLSGLAVGAVWAFFDAFAGGYLLARLYDRLRA
ncbi:MAG: bacteriophage holin [Haloarculaceae archaeon]